MSGNFWQPYRESTQRQLPPVTRVRWVRRFRWGPYRAVVGTDCESDGVVCYLHILAVYREADERPYLVVSSEYQRGQLPAAAPSLGLFFGGKHFILGASAEYADLKLFTGKALKAITGPLGLAADSLAECQEIY